MSPSFDLDTIEDSPAKRRKLDVTQPASGNGAGYNSQDDSGDEIFEDYDTVETVPWKKPTQHADTLATQRLPTPANGNATGREQTQPTQLLNTQQTSGHGSKAGTVQVAASSPPRGPAATETPPRQAARPPGGILASAMAPAGTSFKLPYGVQKSPQKPPVVDLSEEEESQKGDASEDDSVSMPKSDIKPSVFSKTGRDRIGESPLQGNSKFKEITSNSFYKPFEKKPSTLTGSVFDSRNRDESKTTSKFAASSVPKRSSDSMANAYGGTGRGMKPPKQAGPSRALPVEDISIDEIMDFQLRKNAIRIREVLPNTTVRACRDALIAKRGNYEDALNHVLAQEEPHDLTLSDDELEKVPKSASKAAAKREVKAPTRKIHDKWSSTQALPMPQQSPTAVKEYAPLQPKKRLVQGRKDPSSPAQPVSKPARPSTPELDTESESDAENEQPGDEGLEDRVLAFFNTCNAKDLADITNNTEETASTIIDQRPFTILDDVRAITAEVPSKNQNAKRKATKRPIGDKIVETCLEMWTGYEAVDDLVTRCEALGKPVADEMKKWGFDVFGSAKNGELEAVSLKGVKDDSRSSVHDSGIGTPSSSHSGEEQDGDIKGPSATARNKDSGSAFLSQPALMNSDTVLKDYQLVGLNWLALLYKKELSCILADEMGLGKTCQVIAFLAHLFEQGIKGPHLVVVPGSTLENWLREFRNFCPSLVVEPYYGLQKDRDELREKIFLNLDQINVVVTTYDLASNRLDNKFLRHLKPCVCVYDEGHALRNSTSKRYAALMRIPARFRLLLTGTPLQNNLRELAALLGFMLPSLFNEKKWELDSIFKHKAKTNDENHAALLSAQRIARAKSMLTPFVLRRKKHQVLKHLPAKKTRVEHCEITTSQLQVYNDELQSARKTIEERAAGLKPKKANANILMRLRKAAIHPLLFRRHFDDAKIRKIAKDCLREDEFSDRDPDAIYEDLEFYSDFELHEFCAHHPTALSKYNIDEDLCLDSGKVQKMVELLMDFRTQGDRVLVFSQFTMVLDILESVLQSIEMQYFRFDGQTKIDMRQDMIDEFYDDDEITVFLLSTRAGGTGINLACANKVIIFDSSFNPQDDVQAENRAHRVGQTREVEVIRLVTKGTIEEQIHALGETKLALDDRVAGEGATEKEVKDAEDEGIDMVAQMWVKQAGDKI